MAELSRLKHALAERYALEREVGRGGMATVFLARDLKHDRLVAVKVLHPDLAAALGVERFLAEIRTTANLQHPHILPLHDSGEVDGYLFYVMPYVEGETLRARLERESMLPIDDAVRITREVLSALDYAHRHGVVHRDIKPENILLHDGSALVADFGIALAVQSAGGSRMTQTGLSLGTPQYMSPEQAMGEKNVDARADVYATGAVLYELLTGEPPFTGASVQAIVAKVMTERPVPPSTVRDVVPAGVEGAVMRALAKLPVDRWATAALFADALLDTRASHVTTARVVRSPRARMLPWVARAAVAVAMLLLGYLAGNRRQGATVAGIRFTIAMPTDVHPVPGGSMAITRDGRYVAFAAESGGITRIYLRSIGEIAARPVPHTEGAVGPVFSPDGRWIAFRSSTHLSRVPLDGGMPSTITDSSTVDVAWLADGDVLFTRANGRRGLSRVPSAGGSSRTVTLSDSARGQAHIRPVVLPDGDTMLFIIAGPGGVEDDYLAIGSLKSGKYSVTSQLAQVALGSVEGNALFVRPDGALMGAPIDTKSQRITGDAVPLEEGVSSLGRSARLSAAGTLFYSTGEFTQHVVRVDPHGTVTELLPSQGRAYRTPRLSPDGRQLALNIAPPSGGPGDIWIADLGKAAGTVTRVTTTTAGAPSWSPDGKRLYFVRDEGTLRESPASRAADLSDEVQDIPMPDSLRGVMRRIAGILPTPDGHGAVLSTRERTGRLLLSFMNFANHSLRALTAPNVWETYATVSPDGRWLAYVSSESGVADTYVRAFPTGGARVKISQGGGSEPVWSRDGKRVIYRAQNRLMAATVKTDGALSITGRVVLAEDVFVSTGARTIFDLRTSYDIAPDGSLIMVRRTGRDEELTVAVNWLDGVRTKLARR